MVKRCSRKFIYYKIKCLEFLSYLYSVLLIKITRILVSEQLTGAFRNIFLKYNPGKSPLIITG